MCNLQAIAENAYSDGYRVLFESLVAVLSADWVNSTEHDLRQLFLHLGRYYASSLQFEPPELQKSISERQPSCTDDYIRHVSLSVLVPAFLVAQLYLRRY